MIDETLDDESIESSPRMERHRYIARPKICQFCADKNLQIDYKHIDLLRRFVTEVGKIRPRRQTGTCARHQRELAQAIKRSRHLAMLPFSAGGWEERSS